MVLSSEAFDYIAYKEEFPVVAASHLWGQHWDAKCVDFCSDNMSVVSILHSGTSKDPNIMVLLRSLSLRAACYSFAFTASHRSGRDNLLMPYLVLTFSVFIISHHMQHQPQSHHHCWPTFL